MYKKKIITLIALGVLISAFSIIAVKAQPIYMGRMMRSYWGTEDQERVSPYWSTNGWYCEPWWNYPPTTNEPIAEGEIPVPQPPAVPPQYLPRGYGRGGCGWTG